MALGTLVFMTDKPTENTENHAPTAQPVPARAEGTRPQAAAPEPVEFEVRVAPKPGAFLVTGGALGVIVALISAWLGGGTEEHSMGSVFGFLAVLFAIIGVGIGAIVFLIFDRVGRKRTKHIYAVKEDSADGADTANE